MIMISISITITSHTPQVGKGQMGSALTGSLQMSWFLTGVLFGYSRQPSFIFPKVPGRTFFPNLSILITSAAAPLVLTPFFPKMTNLIANYGDPRHDKSRIKQMRPYSTSSVRQVNSAAQHTL